MAQLRWMSRSARAALPIDATGSSTQSCQILAAQAAAIAGPSPTNNRSWRSDDGHARALQFLLQLIGKAFRREIGGGHWCNLIDRPPFPDKG